MYDIPLSILLIPYAIVLFFVAFFSLVNIFHLTNYGATTTSSYAVAFLYFAGIILILAATWFALSGTDWSIPLPVNLGGLPSTNFNNEFPTIPGQ